MALTHSKLLQQWRSRSASGQAEARRVLAEMLTPSGGARSNCYKFISWVTGCSHSTIGRVNEQMKKTGKDTLQICVISKIELKFVSMKNAAQAQIKISLNPTSTKYQHLSW